MTPYFIVFFVLLVFSMFDLIIQSRRSKNIILYLSAILLIVLAGARWNTGTDWGNYLYYFEAIDMTSFGKSGHEFLYDMLLRLVAFFTSDYTGMLFATAIIIVIPTFSTLRRYSMYPVFSVLLLFTYSINSSGFGYRQDIAIAIAFFSFHFILKRQLIRFLMCIVCATLFHQTAVVFVIAYWIYNIKWTRKYFITLLSCVLIGYIVMAKLTFIADLYTQSAQGKLDYYLENNSETFGAGDPTTVIIRGIANRFFLLIIPLIVIKYSRSPKVEELKKIYNIFLFGFIFFITFGSIGTVFLRFTRYFDIFQILVIPLTLFLAGKKYKIGLTLLLVTYLFVKFYIIISADKDVYVPYRTIFDL